jgi:photosystem II stability/assembly factor-like uncharacterized protein
MTYRSTLAILILAAAIVAWAESRVPRVPPHALPSEFWIPAVLDAEVTSSAHVDLRAIALNGNGLGIATSVPSSLQRGQYPESARYARRYWLTSDGGQSWRPENIPGAQGAEAVTLRDNELALMALGNGRIVRSTDGGHEWHMVRPPGGRLVGFSWVNDSTVVAVGSATAVTRDLSGGLIVRSTDSGRTWSNVFVSNQKYAGVAFASAEVGIVAGDDGAILRSTDLGMTWTYLAPITEEMLTGVAFAGPFAVVAVGMHGTILRSGNGGEAWETVPSATTLHLMGVTFADERHGFAVGINGTILHTIDGGLTWSPELSGTRNHLWGAAIGPNGVPVVVGSLDSILLGVPIPGSTYDSVNR